MPNAQKWLEKYYPDKEAHIGSMYINQQLEGILDCSEYKRLEEIYISTQVDSSKFEIINGSYYIWETKIIPCIPAQDWLDKNYPKDKRGEVEVVDFCDFKVEGHLDLSDFVNLKELNLRYSRITSVDLSKNVELWKLICAGNNITELDLSHNSKLTQLEYDYHLAPNLKGLKNTSIIWLDAQYYSQEFSDSQEIWQILVNVRKECFPEMKLIDFSDLNQLAVKTNKETVNQRNFSSEVFPSPPNPKELHGCKSSGLIFWFIKQLDRRLFARILILQSRLYDKKDGEWEKWVNNWGLKCFCCNRTIPKTSAGATYVPKHQELVNKVLSGDKELIGRIIDLPWVKLDNVLQKVTEQLTKTQQELKTEKETSEELRKQTEKEKTDHQQTKPNHQSQLKDLTTILFPSNSCNSFANFAFADLKKQASQIIQENQEAQVKISELESQISNLNQQLYSIQQQTALSQGENLKTAMEKEKKINNLVEGGYWDKQIQDLNDDKLPADKKQITLQTRRRNHYNQLVKSENQTTQLVAQIQIVPK